MNRFFRIFVISKKVLNTITVTVLYTLILNCIQCRYFVYNKNHDVKPILFEALKMDVLRPEVVKFFQSWPEMVELKPFYPFNSQVDGQKKGIEIDMLWAKNEPCPV